MATIEGMVYEDRDGLSVASAGPVIIAGVRHRVAHGFVACNPSLNGRAWNVTTEASACRICYPEEDGQLELFVAPA